MKAKLLFLLALAVMCCTTAMAQTHVKGTVVSDTDSEPLIGVAVLQKGTTNGTITDADGNFSLSVPSNATLVVSYVGYTTQNVAVNGKSNISIRLVEDSKILDDVVVVGYGTMKKSDVSGSVATIDKETMSKKVPTNVAQALQGAAAGVIVTAQDGAPGATSQIRIRGVGTINGTSQPLYVVDGVQVGTSADFVNPSDIESIEVLKDASATAIYGSAGANGVIMITTKHGDKGKMNINITADWGFQTMPYELETLDVDTYAKAIREARYNEGGTYNTTNQVWQEQYDGKRNSINWQDQMTRMGLKSQYGVSATGGTEKTQYSFSVGYLNNQGIVVNTRYNRLTSRASIKSKVNKYIEFGGDINYMRTASKGSNLGLGNNGNLSSHRDMAQLAPTLDYVENNAAGGTLINVNVVNPDGTYGASYPGGTANDYEGMHATYQNVYATQMEQSGISNSHRISISPYVDLSLYKSKHHSLNVHSILNWTVTNSDYDSFTVNPVRYNYIGGVLTSIPVSSSKGYNTFSLSQSTGTTKGIETYMTYKWETDFNNLTVMAGNSVSAYNGQWVSASSYKFLSTQNRLTSLSTDDSSKVGSGGLNADVRTISYYGRIIYSLLDRYVLTATIRRDGSSNFSSGNRWGTFPSAALAWRIKEESFLKDVDWLDNAKVRVGWGQTGNAGGLAGMSTYALSSSNTNYQFYQGSNRAAGIGSTRSKYVGFYPNLVDTNLKWETNEQTNVGVDLGFLGNDLTITLDYFVRKTKDLLLNKTIRPSAGYESIYTNYGEIQNNGFEFSINYNKRINDDWTFGVALNGSTVKNKINKIGDAIYADTGDFDSNNGSTIDGSNVGAIDSGLYWSDHSLSEKGHAVGSFYGWRVEKIIETSEDLAKARAQGQDKAEIGDFLFKDLNGDGILSDGNDDKEILGSGLPKLNFGINFNASYKNFDFALYTYGVLGQKILSYSAMRLTDMVNSDDQSTPNILKSSYKKIQEGKAPRLTYKDLNYNCRVSDYWVKNGNFLKISNIQVGYSVPKSILNTIGVTSLRAYLGIQNLCCISPYHQYGDPECGQGNVLLTGVDTGRYPTPRIYQVGLSVTF